MSRVPFGLGMNKLQIVVASHVSLQVFYFQQTDFLITFYFNSTIVQQILVSFEALRTEYIRCIGFDALCFGLVGY